MSEIYVILMANSYLVNLDEYRPTDEKLPDPKK